MQERDDTKGKCLPYNSSLKNLIVYQQSKII